MTKQTEALKLALAVLKEWRKGFPDDWTDFDTEAVTAIREALAEQPAKHDCCANCMRPQHEHNGNACPKPYTTVWHAWDYDFAPNHPAEPAIKQDLTAEQPAQHQCKFPMCQNEEYQQALAEQIKRELYTGEPAQPQQEPDGWDFIEKMAAERYKVGPSHNSMFYRHAVVAGNGTQQLYLGRELECENMARRFAGAFLDGAFVMQSRTSPPASKPLTDEQRMEMWRTTKFRGNGGQIDWFIEGTRAAEAAHGIKENT